MSFPLQNSFESGQAIGTTITTGNSGGGAGNAWTDITINAGCTATYDANAMHGTLGGKLSIDAAGKFVTIGWDTTAIGTVTELWGSAYFNPSVYPPGQRCRPIFVESAGSTAATVSLEHNGDVRVYDSVDAFVAMGVVLSLNTWYRIAWHYIASLTVGVMDAQVYLGDNLTTLTNGSATVSNGNTKANADRVRFGMNNGEEGGAFACTMDDIRVSATGPIGPSVTGNPGQYATHRGGRGAGW